MKRRAIKSLKIFYLIFLANKKVFSALTRGNGFDPTDWLTTSIHFKWWDFGYDVYGRDRGVLECFKTK